jgi:hypothetical protein
MNKQLVPAHIEESETLGLVRYDAMVLAIAACHCVDEAKGIRDKARAIEVYAAQAMNHDAEKQAAEIRIRAERKTGELIAEGQQTGKIRKSGGDGTNQHQKQLSPRSTIAKTLPELGISRDQSSQWQKLAAMPEEKFNDALVNSPHLVPTTESVLESVKPPFKMTPVSYDKDALLAHGRIMQFKETMQRPAKELFDLMHDYQREEVAALLPEVIAWLQEMK